LTDAANRIRLDKWLHFARFFKTRTLAAAQVTGGHVRVNSEKVAKASAAVGPGDVLTFAQGRRIRVIRIVETGTRRGPASEAQALYEDLSSPLPPVEPSVAPRDDGSGRPTKKDRREIDRLRDL
jgi:ribosome-associated heat shock protein Hsp15